MKRTIIVYGNCQAAQLEQCLKTIPLLHNEYEIIWERNFDHPCLPLKRELLQSQIENCAYFIEQVGLKDIQLPYKELLRPDCVQIRFPYLKLHCLWPLYDPIHDNDFRIKPEPPKFDFGRFPYGDRIVIDMIRQNIPRETIFDEYMKINVTNYVDLDLLYRSDFQHILQVDDKCDIKVYKLIKEGFRIKRHFYSFAHPVSTTLKIILTEILNKSGLIDKNRKDTERQSIRHSIDRFFAKVRHYDTIQVPIHPQVSKYFGLTWANNNTRYMYYDYGYLNFSEYMNYYISYDLESSENNKNLSIPKLEMTVELEKINALLKSKKFEEARLAINQALEKFDWPDFFNLQAELKLQMGKIEEAKEILLNYIERWPTHVNALNKLAVVNIFENNRAEAIKILQEVLRLDPCNTDAIENLKVIKMSSERNTQQILKYSFFK